MRFGNYEVLNRPDGKPDELGRGGFGRTYRARHSFLGTEVALKVILDKLAFDEAAKKRFLKEAREHARLNHPGIARITDFGEAEGTFFYAMELCPHGDLKEYVRKRGPLPPEEALQLIRQTAEALHHAHTSNILHRDIKPSNLLLVYGDHGLPVVKLIDFGLVKRIVKSAADETMDSESASQWSPAFASPEQIRELALDERTDIFSLGMTAWYLIAGGGPVEGSTHEIISERLGDAAYEHRLPASLTGAHRAVVARMIDKSTARRFRNCGELLEELARVLDGGDEPSVTATFKVPASFLPAENRLMSLTERFTLHQAGRSYLGEVFRGFDRGRQTPVLVTVVYKEHDQETLEEAKQRVNALAADQPPGVMPLLEMSEFKEGWAVVEEECTGVPLSDVLRREGAIPLSKMAGVLWDTATGIDAAVECGAQPVPLEQALVEGGEQSPLDWTAARMRVRVQIVAARDEEAGGADLTMTMDTQQMSPLTAFASLVYRAVGGRKPPARAFHSSSACIAIPGLSSSGNRTLAEGLAGEGDTTSCRELLRELFSDEGIPAESVARKAGERRLRSLDTALTHETLRIGRAAATVEEMRHYATIDAGDPTVTIAIRAAAQAAELTGALQRPGARTEAACRDTLVKLRSLAGEAESAAATVSERSQHASVTRAAVTPPPAVSAASQTEWLTAAATAARQAKEGTDNILRVKLPPGMDDGDLCRLQVEARKQAKQASAASQELHDLAHAARLDETAGRRLAESARQSAAAVAQALTSARRLAGISDGDTVTVRAPAPPSTPSYPVVPVQKLPAPPPPPEPAPVRPAVTEEPVHRLQPVAGHLPASPPKKSSGGFLALVSILAVAGAGAGGWYLYQEQKNQPHPVPGKEIAASDTKVTPPEKQRPDDSGESGKAKEKEKEKQEPGGDSGQTTSGGKEEKKEPENDDKVPVVTPPATREFAIVLTGDLPAADSEVTFTGTSEAPAVERTPDKIVFTFTLEQDAENPQAVLDEKQYAISPGTEDANHTELALSRMLPPATLRLKGLDALADQTAVTIAGQTGVMENGALVFKHGAAADGKFILDAPCWQSVGETMEAEPGVWEATLELKLETVSFTVPSGGNPWKTVKFTPVKPEVMPLFTSLEGLGPHASAAGSDVTFTLDDTDPEPALLPAGDYTLIWTATDVTAPSREGDRFTVQPGKDNALTIPAK